MRDVFDFSMVFLDWEAFRKSQFFRFMCFILRWLLAFLKKWPGFGQGQKNPYSRFSVDETRRTFLKWARCSRMVLLSFDVMTTWEFT